MLSDFASSDLGCRGLNWVEFAEVRVRSTADFMHKPDRPKPCIPGSAKEFLRTPPKQLREQLPPRAVGSSRTKDLHTFVP